jgi:hypothetical protein
MLATMSIAVAAVAMPVVAAALRFVHAPSRRQLLADAQRRREKLGGSTDAALIDLVLAHAACDAGEEGAHLVQLLVDGRHQAALDVFDRLAGDDASAAGDALEVLAERLARVDFAPATDAALLVLLRNHPYFEAFQCRSPPTVRRFYDLLNQGRYEALADGWTDLVADLWDDEGGTARRSRRFAPELHAALMLLRERAAPTLDS